jgi:PAS domain S-box-containing protein
MPRNPTLRKSRPRRVDAGPPAATTERLEAPFRAIVELALYALVVSDLAGHITPVNRQTEALFGYPREALLGQPVEVLLPERFYVVHRQHRADYLAAPRTRPMGTRLSLWGRRSDGSQFPVAVSLSPLPDTDTDSVFAVVSTIRDLSEHHRLEAARDAAEAAGQELRRLQAITDTALAYPQLDDLLDAVLERLQEVLEADNAAILLLQEDGRHLVIRAARGLEAQVVGGLRIPIGEGFAGRIAATRAPLKVADLSTYPVVNPLLHGRLRSVVGVSLVVDGRLIGVLHIGSATLRHFTEEETHLLQLVGERVALAVDHARVNAREREAHAETATRAAELEATIEAMEDGVVVYDAAGRMVRVNTAGMRLFGLDALASFTQQAMEARAALTWPRDAQGDPLPYDEVPPVRVLRGEQLQGADAVDVLVRLPDGREKQVQVTGAPLRDAAGTITGAVVAYHDITERKRLEQELAERAGLLETSFEAMADGLTVFDAEGRLVRTNRTIRALTASGEGADFVALPAVERAGLVAARHPDGRPMAPEEWPVARVLHGEMTATSAPMDMVITNLAGRELTLSISGVPIKDAAGQVIGGVVLYRDVTEQRRLERERAEILGMVAHDLGNPLSVVKARVQRLQRRLTQGKPLPADALDVVGRAVDRMERLVADLRVTVSLEGGHFELALEPCDLVARCHEAAEAARLSSGRAVTLVVPEEPVVVTADGDRIGQVLANLLSNALKYSPAERPVELTLTTAAVANEPAAGAGHRSRPGSQLAARIAVRDTGRGIPPEALPHLFDRFYRVPGVDVQQGSGRGLGLGLYIACELVERHSGQIGVESVVGEGSTFWFTLPLASTQP